MSRKIVIDARITGSSTGVYSENLLNHLQKIDSKNQYFVLLRDLTSWKPTAKNFTAIHAPVKDYTFAEQISLAKTLHALKPDLVHFCMPNQPLLYFGKRVTTVHDLTLIKFENIDMNPAIYRIRKAIFNLLVRNVIWRSHAVVTPTEYVRNDVLEFSGRQHADKVFTTLEAGDPLAGRPVAISDLKNKKFVFFIGNAFPYKNLKRIVDAYKQVQSNHPELHLVFAGKKEFFYEDLERYVDKQDVENVHFLGFVSEGEKRWLFQNAQAYVVASLSEGFHIPALEAMYEGCPVISSNATCLPEVCASAAVYFDPLSTSGLEKAIKSVLEDKKLRNKVVEAGYGRVKEFSWKRMAQETLDVYESVLSSDKTM